MRKIVSVLFLAFLLLTTAYSANPCSAGGSAPADEFIIKADSGANSFNGSPSIAWDGTNFLTVWLKGTDIYGARVSPDGEVLDPDGIAISVGLNSSTVDPRPPSVAFDGTNWLVVWVSSRDGAYEVYGCRVTPGGTVLDAAGLRITTGGSPKAKPVGIARGASDCLLVWRTASDRVMGVRVGVDGAAIGDPAGFQIAANGFYPAVAYDATDGLYLVTWHQGSFDWPVCGARVTDAGAVLDPTGILICDDGGNKEYARPAFDGTNFMVIWYDWRSGGQEIGSCYGARVTPGGAVLDDPSFFIAGHVAGRTFPNIVFDGTDYLAVWSATAIWSGDKFRLPDAYAARISTGGTVLDRQAVPLCTGYAHQVSPSVAYGGGRYLTAWFDLRHKFNNGAEALYGRILDKGFDSLQTPYSPQALPTEVTWEAQSIGIGTAAASGMATDSGNAWLFCGTNSLVYRNGAWSVEEGIGGESACFATGASDIWAGGGSGFIVNRTNGAWQDVRPDSGSPFLTGIWGNTHNDIWASLSSIHAFTHFNGSKWQNVPSASPGEVFDIMGAGPSDIWAVGERGEVQRWNGTSWSRAAGIPTLQTLNAVWVNGPGDVFAVGDHGTILHYNGTAWTAQTSPTSAHLKDVWGVDSSCVYAVGAGGAVLHYDGSTWSLENAGTVNDLLTVFGGYSADGACKLWTAGYGTAIYTKTIPASAPITAVPEAFSVSSTGLDCATLAWTLPDDRNVTGYVLEYRAGGVADWTAIQTNRAAEHTVSGLDNTKTYAFRLRAQYRYAYSSPATAETGGAVLKLGVTFDTQGGSETPVAAVTNGSAVVKPPDPTKDGFLFGGWYTDTSYAPDKEWDFDTPVTANMELFARWLDPACTVTLDRLDGTVPVQVAADTGSAMARPATPMRDGYIFDDWYTGSNLVTKWNFADAVWSDMTLFARWIPRQYVVTFEYRDGSTPQSQKTVTYSAPFGSLPQAERMGYNFDGWYPQTQGGARVQSGDIITALSDFTLYAQWTPRQYLVTFEYQDGSTPQTHKTVTYDAAYGSLPQAKRLNYDFEGWYTQATGGERIDSGSTVTKATDHTLFAHWTLRSCIVTFDRLDGSEPVQVTVDVGKAMAYPANPVRNGYSFIDWFTDSNYITKWNFGNFVWSDMTLYAKWTPLQYLVTLEYQDGSTPQSQKAVTYDAPYGSLPYMERKGYNFDGWYTEAQGGERINSGSIVTKATDHTLFAHWTLRSFIVTFDRLDGTVPVQLAVDAGKAMARPADPVRNGYSFIDWFTGNDCVTKWNFGDFVWSDMTLYTKWTVRDYTVIFEPGNGQSATQSKVNYGAKIPMPPQPSRADCVFTGWYRDEACSAAWDFNADAVTGDITLYAGYASSIPVVTAASISYNSVSLTWTAVPGASGYEVWSAAASGGVYTRLGETAGNSYAKSALQTGVPYWYKVRSYADTASGRAVSSFSATVSAIPVPATPALSLYPSSYNSVKISWTAVAGATKYELWRATSPNGKYKRLASSTARSYTDKNLSTGTTYYYKVNVYRAMGKKKVYGSWSETAAAKTVLGTPGRFKAARAGATRAALSWSAVAGRTKYEVWRSNAADGVYALAGTTASTKYTDKKLIAGQPYWYKVRAYRAVGGKKVYGEYSGPLYCKS